MSEHSEYYHDADRNKPLPGAPVSSKEEVLQTLLDAARGEITALTEANKLLAAQVAVDGGSTDWRIYHSALSQCAELLDNMADNDALVDTPKYLALKLASAQAVPVAASIGDDPKFHQLAMTYRASVTPHVETEWFKMVRYLDSRAAKVSARAADALDSQPTVSAVLAELRADIRELQNNLEAFGEYSQETARVALDGALEALDKCAERHASSQPTDGEVRK